MKAQAVPMHSGLGGASCNDNVELFISGTHGAGGSEAQMGLRDAAQLSTARPLPGPPTGHGIDAAKG